MDNQEWSYSQHYLWKDASCTSNEQSPINIDTFNIIKCNVLCDLQLYLKLLMLLEFHN